MKSAVRVVAFAMLVGPLLLSESSGADPRQMSQGSAMANRPMMSQSRMVSKQLLLDPLPAGSYTIGVGGYLPTIDSAYRRLEAGGIAGPVTLLLTDTLYVAPFPPGDFRLIGPIAGAGPTSRITVRPADNVAVRIEGSGTATLTFEDVSYLTLDGISLEGSTRLKVRTSANTYYEWNDAIDLWGDCDHDVIQNLTAGTDRIGSPWWTSTVLLLSKDYTTPDSCVVSGVSVTSGPTGISVGGYSPFSNRPRGNVIIGCHIGSSTDSAITWGIFLNGTVGSIVDGNHVEHLRLPLVDPGLTSATGIECFYGSNSIIRNNVIHGLRGVRSTQVEGIVGSGDATYYGQGLQIYNNMVYDIQLTGIDTGYVGGIGVWRNDSVLVAYNSVRMEGAAPIGMGTDALAFIEGVTGATVRNNILVNLFQGGGNSALWWDSSATITSDHNDLHIDTSVVYSSTVVRWPLQDYRLLADWQATGQDAHSVSVMPPFSSATDLHISNDSTPVADAASPIAGILSDFDGDPRPRPGDHAPDIGADEFVHPTGVEDAASRVPVSFALEQNYPNPFNPTTGIRYQVPGVSEVKLVVYDLLGREVAVLLNERRLPGSYEVKFDASGLASGVYFYRLIAGSPPTGSGPRAESSGFVQTRKMLVIK